MTTIQTDDWGNYNYMGLTCGSYRIDIPKSALDQRKLKKVSAEIPTIVIEPSIEGEQIDLLNMQLETVTE